MTIPGPENTMRVLAAALSLAVLVVLPAPAQQPKAKAIPNLASANFGWQTNFEDWQDPGPDYGHGPMSNDPAYPFVNNSVVDSQENSSVAEQCSQVGCQDSLNNYVIRN